MSYAVVINKNFHSVADEDLARVSLLNMIDGQYNFLIDKKKISIHDVEIDRIAKQVTFYKDGKKFSFEIKNEVDQLIRNLGFAAQSSSTENHVEAPMPGLVLDVLVAEGDAIEAGEGLLILEAMKMENILKAPRAGVVKKVNTDKGDSVDKHQVLIELEY